MVKAAKTITDSYMNVVRSGRKEKDFLSPSERFQQENGTLELEITREEKVWLYYCEHAEPSEDNSTTRQRRYADDDVGALFDREFQLRKKEEAAEAAEAADSAATNLREKKSSPTARQTSPLTSKEIACYYHTG